MEHIINKIIEIEKNAQQKVIDIKNEQHDLPRKIQEFLESLEATLAEKARERIAKINEVESEISEEKIKQIEEEHKTRLEKIDIIKKEHAEEWIEKIYQDIIFSN